MTKKEDALCDDCGLPFRDILDLHDYWTEDMKHHCVCSKCTKAAIMKHGEDNLKKWALEVRMATL